MGSDEWRRNVDGARVVRTGAHWSVANASRRPVKGPDGAPLAFETDESAREACDLGKVPGVLPARED